MAPANSFIKDNQIKRTLNSTEQALLKKLRTETEKTLKQKFKFHYFIIALISGVVFAYLASMIKIDFLIFAFGTIAVFAFSFIVFMPYEIYKDSVRLKKILKSIDSFVEKNELHVVPVKALRIAIAKEFEDEGDLVIVEYEVGKVLYLWDYEYGIAKRLCLDFEIYEEGFFELTGRQVYPLSEKIKPVEIDRKAKWEYMSKVGSPGHLQVKRISFDQLLEQYKVRLK